MFLHAPVPTARAHYPWHALRRPASHPCPRWLYQLCAAEQVLVELAIEREQDIPALIYEGRSRAVGSHSCLPRVCFLRRRASLPGC